MFHFSKSNFTLDFLTKETIGIPVKLILCLNRPFVPIISSSHELSNLWGNKWVVDDFTSQVLTIFSFVVKTTSISVCDLLVTLVGSLTNCVQLKVEQKSDKARPSGQFP